jgi:hypothetical protein
MVNVLPTGCRAPWIFDNALSVNGNTLRFNAPGYDPGSPGLTVKLQRSGNQLSGTLSGSATYQGLPNVEVFSGSDYSNLSSPAETAGSGDNTVSLAVSVALRITTPMAWPMATASMPRLIGR